MNTDRRSNEGRGIYVAVAVIPAPLALLSAGMADSLSGALWYLPIIALCVVQYLRPTLLGWFALTAPFWPRSLSGPQNAGKAMVD